MGLAQCSINLIKINLTSRCRIGSLSSQRIQESTLSAVATNLSKEQSQGGGGAFVHANPASATPENRVAMRGGCAVETKHLYQWGAMALPKLFNSAPREIESYDIAEMNLICALGLPGAEHLNIEALLKLLDICAKRC